MGSVWENPASEASFPRVDGRMSCSIAVVGAGVAGTSLAYHLARRGVKVTLLESGLIGREGSGDGNGMALPGTAEHYWTMLEALGREKTRQWWRLADQGVCALTELLKQHRPDFDWTRGAALLLADSKTELDEMVKAAREQVEDGFEPRLMSADAASNYVPVANCEGALYLPGAVCLDPARALNWMASLAHERGATVFQESPVREVQLQDGRARAHCDEGVVEAEIVVVAAGTGTADLLDLKQIFPLRGQSFSTAPVREGPRGTTPAVSCNRGHEMYRRLPGGGMLASGINPGASSQEKTAVRAVDDEFQSFLEGLAHKHLPEIARVPVEARWASIYTYTVDGLPLVGPLPGHNRIHALCGFSSRSWSLGFAAGLVMADLLNDQDAELPKGCSPRRFL